MRQYAAVLTALALVLSGCGTEAPVAQPPSSAPPTTTTTSTTSSAPPTTSTTSSTPSPTRTTNPNPLAAPSTRVRDCFDGDCVLLLTKPTTIPLDAKTLYYPSIRVTAISAEGLSFTVNSPQGGRTTMSFGPGVGNGKLGISGSAALEVGLTMVDGKPALVLQLGPAAS